MSKHLRHPFFRARWRRMFVCAWTGLWALGEFAFGNYGWALFVGLIAAFCTYEFFIVFDAANYEEKDNG